MSPVLDLIMGLRFYIYLGHSFQKAMQMTLEGRRDEFSLAVHSWFIKFLSGHPVSAESIPELVKSPVRKTLLLVMEQGMAGTPVNQSLQELEAEGYFMMEALFEKKLQLLPLKMMMPLVLLILPAVMMLLIAPLLMAINWS